MENGSFVGENMTKSYTNRSSNNELDPSQATSFSYRPFLAPIKVFRCKYCGRKFLNSRALGGHQNAHKKERTLWVMGLSSSTNHKSLGMVPHALPDKPVQETGKPKESFKRFQDAWRQQISVQSADQDDLRWPGSFQVDSTDSIHGSVVSPPKPDQSNVRALDLDLRLGCL